MCVRCGTGGIAWCTDPYRHGESAEPVSPGDPPAVAGLTADVHDRGGNGMNGDSTWAPTDGHGCPVCGAVFPGGHGGGCPNTGRNYDWEGRDA
jgi:hypothetical protein